jgi:Fanconi-associated nuclease 1
MKRKSPDGKVSQKKPKIEVFEDSQDSAITDLSLDSISQNDSLSQSFDDLNSSQNTSMEGVIWDGKPYYLRHFDYMIDTVMETHDHLLHEHEQDMLTIYKEKLSQDCQKLLVRMFNRKGPWFMKNEMKQKYARDFEDMDIAIFLEQLAELQIVKLIKSNSSDTLAIDKESFVSLFQVLNVQQCNNIADQYWKHIAKKQRPTKKVDIVRQLIEYNKNKDIAGQNEKKKSTDTKLQSKISKFFTKSPATPSKGPLSDEAHYNDLAKKILKQLGSGEIIVRISENYLELFKLFNRVFTLTHTNTNGQSSTTMLVLTETMKKIRFPNIQIPSLEERKKFKFFETRQDYDEYEQAQEMQQLYHQLVEEEYNYERAVKECLEPAALKLAHQSAKHKERIDRDEGKTYYFLLRYTAGWIYSRIVDSAISILESKLKRHDAATQYLYTLLDSPFHIGSRGKWYERLALDYQQHLKQKSNAYQICMRALTTEADILCLADRYTLEKRLQRLEGNAPLQLSKDPTPPKYKYTLFNELKPIREVHIRSERLSQPIGRSKKSLFLSYDGKTKVYVEQLALQYYALAQGFEGIHCEGSLCTTLYGLLCWDIIFDTTAAPYAFQSKYQDSPLDLFTDAFFVTRRELFEARFKQMIESEDGSYMIDLIKKVVAENEGVQNKFIRWAREENEELDDEQSQSSRSSGIARGEGISADNVEWLCDLVTCLGGKTLSMVCRMLAEDYRFYRSGMPDLLVWNVQQSMLLHNL